MKAIESTIAFHGEQMSIKQIESHMYANQVEHFEHTDLRMQLPNINGEMIAE